MRVFASYNGTEYVADKVILADDGQIILERVQMLVNSPRGYGGQTWRRVPKPGIGPRIALGRAERKRRAAETAS